jgi:thiamine biosynthesis lipoprotein
LESTQVSELLRLSAFKSVALENGRLRKLNNGSIDFSAIAKGYAVDAVSEYLSRIGQENYLIELGGEIYAAGTNQAGVSWRLGIEEPDFMGRKSYNVVEINNQALATSGDYRNFIEENGHRYSHTIDPKTGYPVERSVASVSVIAATCAEADAWATALSAMGSEKAVNFAEENKLNAFFILRQDESFLTAVTGEFGRHLLTEQG